MATVGIVGGLGPESTIDYYRRILEAWEQEDPSTAPSVVIDSLDVQRALRLVERDRPALTDYLLASVRRLAGAGVDFVAMSANTPHIVFDEVAARSPVPLLSIVEVCADEARRRGFRRLALVGTRFTMEAPFYPTVCGRRGLAVVAPDEADRTWIHSRYVGELLRGEFRDETRQEFVDLVRRLREASRVDGVILAGTELPLLLPGPAIAGIPALDTTALHVAAIVGRLREAAGGEAPRDAASDVLASVHRRLPLIIETPRLLIRELTLDDAGFVLRLTNEPSFLANIGDKGVRTMDDARRFLLEGPWTNQPKAGYGQFLVQLKDSGAAAGICGLLYRERLDVTDIGFAFLPEFWGRGLALEAARAVMEYGRGRLGAGPVVGLTTKDNLPSIRLLEKLGMRFQKMVRMSDEDPGTALYS